MSSFRNGFRIFQPNFSSLVNSCCTPTMQFNPRVHSMLKPRPAADTSLRMMFSQLSTTATCGMQEPHTFVLEIFLSGEVDKALISVVLKANQKKKEMCTLKSSVGAHTSGCPAPAASWRFPGHGQHHQRAHKVFKGLLHVVHEKQSHFTFCSPICTSKECQNRTC